MFGYIHADVPYLYIKDETLYKAMYCGLCKSIGKVCGQAARMGLSYDVTFLSVILHNIKGVDVTVERSHCLTHRIRKRPMARPDPLTMQLAAVNTALIYYKCTDDIEDGDRGKGRRLWFVKGHKRVVKAYPEIERIIRDNLAEQQRVERSGTSSVDRAADSTANMLAELSDLLLEDKRSPFTHGLFYAIGKWIYLIDALDDYDKDKKKGAYNPIVGSFPADSRVQALEKYGAEIQYIFNSLFYDIRENLANIRFRFNRDLTDNILIRGLPAETKRVMKKPCKNCDSRKCKAKEAVRRNSENPEEQDKEQDKDKDKDETVTHTESNKEE